MSRTVRRGDRGSQVKSLQEFLNRHGYKVSEDGAFGPGTETKLIQFQRAAGIGADGVAGPKTWEKLLDVLQEPKEEDKRPPGPTPPVLAHLESLGHKILWEGDFHLNLFGIRNPNAQSNSFDDIFGCAYTENGLWKVHYWPSTTDPGTYWLENPMRSDGTAILCPGQYVSWKIGPHGKTKYEALVQRAGPVKVWRDSNKDEILDHEGEQIEGWYGINLHRSSLRGESAEINKWSAGCQVHARLDGFHEMMALAHKQRDTLGIEEFGYTLMDQWW